MIHIKYMINTWSHMLIKYNHLLIVKHDLSFIRLMTKETDNKLSDDELEVIVYGATYQLRRDNIVIIVIYSIKSKC